MKKKKLTIKNFILYAIAALSCVLMCYVGIGFVMMEFNLFKWGAPLRLLFLVSIVVTASFVVAIHNEKNEHNK